MEKATATSPLGAPRFTSRAERIACLVAGVFALGGAALFFYGEQAVGIGTAGVVNKFLGSLGMALFSIGLFVIGLCFLRWLIVSFGTLNANERAITLKAFGKQLLVGILNVAIYGGIAVIFLGGIAALDGASAGTLLVVGVAWILCAAVFIFYRRYRKKHKMSYQLLGNVGLTVFLLLFAVFFLGIFIRSQAPGAFQDLTEGPKTADVLLVEADINYPSYRYRAFIQDKHILTFHTADDERIKLEVPEKDIMAAKVINDYGNFVHLTYYPHSQVFCEATPWPEGAEIMGPELLQKLVDEYKFEL